MGTDNLGLGVMIQMLGGNEESVKAYHAAMGLKIKSAILDNQLEEDGAVVLTFENNSTLTIMDTGRSCCENRYITCDDDLSKLKGETFFEIQVKDGPEFEEDYDTHETKFVEIICVGGTNVVLTTHNEHNGYYGGFSIKLKFQEES